jgi:hypothetical protein
MAFPQILALAESIIERMDENAPLSGKRITLLYMGLTPSGLPIFCFVM